MFLPPRENHASEQCMARELKEIDIEDGTEDGKLTRESSGS